MRIGFWLRSLWQRHGPKRRLIVVEGDTPPAPIPSRHVYLCRDDGDDWSVAMRCPCGCGDDLELMLLKEVNRPGFTGEFFVQNLCDFIKGVHACMGMSRLMLKL